MKNKKKFYVIVPVIAVLLCVVVIGVAVILGVPDKVSAAQAGKQIDLGNKYLAAAEYDKAEVSFAKALKISPKSAKAATGMAKVYNKKKQPEKAVKYLKKASENLTTGEDAKELQKAVTETKEQIVVQSGADTQNTENDFADKNIRNIDNSETLDLTKIEEAVNKIMARLMPVAVVKNDEDKGDTSENNDRDFDGNSAGKGAGSDNDEDIYEEDDTYDSTDDDVVIIDPTVSPKITGKSEPSVTEDETEAETTVTPEVTVTPEITESPEDEAGNREVDGIPVAKEDEEKEDEETYSGNEKYVEITAQPEMTPIGGDTEHDELGQIPSDDEKTTSDTTGGEAEKIMDGETDEASEGDEATAETENSTDSAAETNVDADVVISDPENILEDYKENTLSTELPTVSWSDTQIPFTYGEASSTALTGRLADKTEDIDGDGIKELLVVEVNNGNLAFRVYKAENGTVELKDSQTVSTGMQTPLVDMSYGNTQECFLINNAGKWEIGFVTYSFGYDSGDGTPAVLTAVEVYSVEADAGIKLCASGSVENGQGHEELISALSIAGLNCSWNNSNVAALQSIGYVDNPEQDLSGEPDPIGNGISTSENGCTDLAVLTVRMAAGSGILTVKSK